MKLRYALLLGASIGLTLGLSLDSAWAGPPSSITNTVGVCDPWFPNRCIAPTSDGKVTVTGTVNATVTQTSTAAAPSYSEGTANPFSGNLSGDLRTIAKQSGTWTVGASNFPATVSVNTGAVDASSPRVAVARDATTIAGAAPGTAGTASAQVVSVQGIASGTNLPVSQATAASLNATVVGTGTFATQSSASQSGTWTVQPGNTPNTTPWLVAQTPTTTGGVLVVAASTITNTAAAVKNNAGQVYGYIAYNPNAAVCYLQVYNVVAASVTVGTTPATWWLPLPANGGANMSFDSGVAHSTGISIAATTTPTGSTACSSTLIVTFFYK